MNKQFFYLVLYVIILILPAYLLGAFEPSDDEFQIRLRNAAIAMPIMGAFAFWGARFLLKKTFSCLVLFLDSENIASGNEDLPAKFKKQSAKLVLPSIVVGIAVTVIYNYLEGILSLRISGLMNYLLFTASAFWAACFYLCLTLIFITRYVIQNFLDKDTIDLFAIKELKPISDLAVYNVAISACFLSLSPFFWLGKSIPLTDIGLLLLVFLCLSYYLFIPIINVHMLLSKRKTLAIERLNGSIRRLMLKNNFKRQTEFFSKPKQLRDLASLICAKNEINDATDWPIDLPQGIRGLLISISIPLSWVAGSLIEAWISNKGWVTNFMV